MRPLLQVRAAHKAYGAKVLLGDETFSINEDEHVGIIGPNGAGKSTLFRALTGEEELDRGEIVRSSHLRLGYLAQEDRWEDGETPEDHLTRHCITPIWDLKALGAGLGLDEDRFRAPVKSMSGGYRMRVKLLKMIGMQPNLMLLDEPTNYLDLETLLVLENFLLGFNGAFMLISHDREFLKRVTDHILEIEGGTTAKFPGTIEDYFEQKAMIRDQEMKAAMSAEAKKKNILDFAARFGAKATKARQVQSRLKQLERMETVEVKALPVRARIRIPSPTPTGKSVLTTEGVTLGYGGPPVLKDVNVDIARGDRVGIVGLNGAGKSTLLKALAARLTPTAGKVTLGYQASVAYFAQHVAEELDPRDTVLQAMSRAAHPEVLRQDILDLAGSLLFSGADVDKPVRVLSGGEKSRVALGQILLKRAPCLILDEPTNHLDFDTVEALTQSLASYEGTVLTVSHDRGFIRRVASRILEIRDGTARLYPGTYDEYVWSLQRGLLGGAAPGSAPKTPARSSGGDAAAAPSKFNYKEAKKDLQRQVRAIEKQCSDLEKVVETSQAKIVELTEKLLTLAGEEASKMAKTLAGLQAEADAAETRWFALLEDKAALETQVAELDAQV